MPGRTRPTPPAKTPNKDRLQIILYIGSGIILPHAFSSTHRSSISGPLTWPYNYKTFSLLYTYILYITNILEDPEFSTMMTWWWISDNKRVQTKYSRKLPKLVWWWWCPPRCRPLEMVERGRVSVAAARDCMSLACGNQRCWDVTTPSAGMIDLYKAKTQNFKQTSMINKINR